MKATLITKEYPPQVYGGAGVHVRFLAQELAKIMDVEVRCFGDQKVDEAHLSVRGYRAWARMWEGQEPRFNSALGTFSTDLSVIRDDMDSDLVHTHTWYSSLAGFLAKQLYGIPLVVTVHSLEPLRPWKEEQLGRSYGLSTWAEKLALENADGIVAVSRHSKEDILRFFDVNPDRIRVIHNGIDLDIYKPRPTDGTRKAYGIEGDYVLFVGRTSRQKGMEHLISAMQWVNPGVRCVCCTSAPDTKEVEQEIAALVGAEPRVLWINSLLREDQYAELYSHARVFVCPSVYEPFGIINLESMACETPVVASAIGGILETVVDGQTGTLVEPASPRALAHAINDLLDNPEKAKEFGRQGRRRVEEHFAWTSIARQTASFYEEVIEAYLGKSAGESSEMGRAAAAPGA